MSQEAPGPIAIIRKDLPCAIAQNNLVLDGLRLRRGTSIGFSYKEKELTTPTLVLWRGGKETQIDFDKHVDWSQLPPVTVSNAVIAFHIERNGYDNLTGGLVANTLADVATLTMAMMGEGDPTEPAKTEITVRAGAYCGRAIVSLADIINYVGETTPAPAAEA